MHIVQLRIVCAGRHEAGWSRSLTAYMGVLYFPTGAVASGSLNSKERSFCLQADSCLGELGSGKNINRPKFLIC